MERNIAALMREDTFTVKVSFGSTDKTYTYIAWMPLKVGDLIVVPTGGTYKIVEVVEVEDRVNIAPGDTIRYSWVVGKVDLEAFNACVERNTAIEDLVQSAYQANLRRSFAAQILGELDDAAKARVQALIAPKAD